MKGGAYRLKPSFRLPPMMFTDEEAFALTLGLRALRHLGLAAFAPDNLREGSYNFAVDEKTLPEYAVINKPDNDSVSLRLGEQPKIVNFQLEVHKPEKTTRKVF